MGNLVDDQNPKSYFMSYGEKNMGLFDYMKKTKELGRYSAIDLLSKHDKGEMNDEVFLSGFGQINIFYSTPFGDHKDGGQRVFLLPAPNNTGYHPVFSSQERLIEFYEKAGRVGFMIMNGTFSSVLATTKDINEKASVKMGIIIDPGYYNVTVDVSRLDTVIGMTKR